MWYQPRLFPHSPQNFAPASFLCPHSVQNQEDSSGRFAPHSEQNLPVFFAPQEQVQPPTASGFLAPHSEQNLPVFCAPQAQVQPPAVCAACA